MAVAQASCPNCGAPLEFGLGSSWARVCDYCRHTVVRTDRGLQNMGQAAALANTPSLVAVGDEGVLGGRPFRVFGRVQLDHGAGPWDEYYLGFDYGQAWGFLAYAQGEWYATALSAALPVPAHQQLQLEQDLMLGAAGAFRVAEIKAARIVATEGEIPSGTREGMQRLYADCWGRGRGFATLDYGETGSSAQLFLGYVLSEAELSITQLGPRTAQRVKAEQLTCPNCGGDIPKLSGERSQRLGCPYCGAVSDIALRTVVAQQERLQQATAIPVGSRGTLESVEYLCIAYLRRSTSFEGEPYGWEEYLLFSPGIGFRWLVKDPETGWSWVTPVNPAKSTSSTPTFASPTEGEPTACVTAIWRGWTMCWARYSGNARWARPRTSLTTSPGKTCCRARAMARSRCAGARHPPCRGPCSRAPSTYPSTGRVPPTSRAMTASS